MSTLPVVSSSPKRSANLSLSADVLDAGEALSDGDYRKLELAARLKQADAIRAEVEEAA